MRLLAAAALALGTLVFAAPTLAAVPPFELVQKSLAQHRKGKSVDLAYRVSVTGKSVRDYTLRGEVDMGHEVGLDGEDAPRLGPRADVGFRLLWIALLAPDPIASLSAFGFVKSDAAEVAVAQDFVYVYGTSPRVAVYRDLRRLAWFEVESEEVSWRTELTYRDEDVTGANVTRNGVPYVTLRAAK